MSVEFDTSEVVALAAELAAAGPRVERRADDALDEVADRTLAVAKGAAPVATGTLRNSIEVSESGDEREVGSSLRYARHVEYGTSVMAPQPFILPAANVADGLLPKAIADIGDPFD